MKNKRRLKVAIGYSFGGSGGVDQHINAIQKYSSHRLFQIPPHFIGKLVGNIAPTRVGLVHSYYRIFISKYSLIGFDILHSHPEPSFINLCMKSKGKNCKWIHTYHTLYFEDDYIDGLRPEQKRDNQALIEKASLADVKITVSNWLHDYLFNNYSIHTEVIPNGVDVAECDTADKERFIKKYGFDKFILFVGSIDMIKNPLLFVRLAENMPEIRFVMIGRQLNSNNILNPNYAMIY
jgi:glycosyltransferase involved in cell wall biosynthesis